ncbi:hypothetical protein ACFVAQ_45580 [Streptomyces sp. NPDC057651]|uniref:hypothetical protein n=1 Tax=Streptomyces sp. NPDC057651 TaxID=3346194 RepID=UPI00368F2279
MIGRTPLALALALFALGLTIGLLGLFDKEGVYARAGLLLTVAAMAPLIVWQSQRAHQATADQLAAEHDAGYRLALEHVARGLLDQPTAPPDGGDRAEATDDHDDHHADGIRPCKVRRLFAVDKPRIIRDDTTQEKRTGT